MSPPLLSSLLFYRVQGRTKRKKRKREAEEEEKAHPPPLTVRVLGLRRPRVPLLEPAALDLDVELLVLGVDARRRRVEEPLDVGDAGDLEHVEGDHGVVVHDHRVVGLDEAARQSWWDGIWRVRRMRRR